MTRSELDTRGMTRPSQQQPALRPPPLPTRKPWQTEAGGQPSSSCRGRVAAKGRRLRHGAAPTREHPTRRNIRAVPARMGDRITFGAGRSWGETLKFAIRANACADRRRTSPPSRAGIYIWRAAGLLRQRRCGPVRAADAPPATEPLSVCRGKAPSLSGCGSRPANCRSSR